MNSQATYQYAPTTRYEAVRPDHLMALAGATGTPGAHGAHGDAARIGFDGLAGHHSTITITQDPRTRRTAVWLTLAILAVTALLTLGTTWFVMAGVDDAMADAERMATTQQEQTERLVDEQIGSVTEQLDDAVPAQP